MPDIAPLLHPAVRGHELEWRRLRRSPHALRQAAAWQLTEWPPESLDDVLRAIGYERVSSRTCDARLRMLVELAATDSLAAQVVVRRLLPGALSVAGRYRSRAGADAFDEILGALWIAIRTFDPARCPSSIAGALLSDAEYRAFRRSARRGVREQPCEHLGERASVEPSGDPTVELAELLAAACRLGVADDADIELVELLLAEPNATQLARRLHLNARTVRSRRARLTAKLRDAAEMAA